METKKIYDKVTGYYQPVVSVLLLLLHSFEIIQILQYKIKTKFVIMKPVITEEIDISTTGTIVKSVPHNDHLQNIPNLPDLPPGVFQPNASPAPTRGLFI